MKANAVCGNEVELAAKIRKRRLSFDAADDARDPEQLSGCGEKGFGVGVEAKNIVAKMLADVEEVTRAAAEIENSRWRSTVEPQILRALDVNPDPICDIFETIDLRRTRPVRIFVAQVSELQPIDIVQNLAFVDWMGQPADVFRSAGEYFAGKQLLELA